MRKLYKSSLLTDSHSLSKSTYMLCIVAFLSHFFKWQFDEYRIYIQHLICYFEVHTDDLQYVYI